MSVASIILGVARKVCGVDPDAAGNVTLTAANVGAQAISQRSQPGGYAGVGPATVWANAAPYYASGSASMTTGGITEGQSSLVLASVIDFQIGQGLSVAGAGTAGAFLAATITAITGTTLTLGTTASTTVSAAAVRHDETVAINAAMTAIVALGGGTVRLYDGTYWCNGPLDSHTNSVLAIPFVADGSANIPIALRGETAPTMNPYTGPQPTNGGVHIWTLVSGSGTLPAILAASARSNASGFNQATFYCRNVFFHTYDNPTISAANLSACVSAVVEDVQIDTGVAQGSESQPTTSTSYGLQMPAISNAGLSIANRVTVVGYAKLLQVAEHAHFDVILIHGLTAIECSAPGNSHPAYGRANIFQCVTSVLGTGTLPINFDIECELDKTGDGKWWAWQSGKDIYDPSSNLRGFVNYAATDSGTGAVDALSETGALNVNVTNIVQGPMEFSFPGMAGPILIGAGQGGISQLFWGNPSGDSPNSSAPNFYSDTNYLVVNSKSGNPLYLNFDSSGNVIACNGGGQFCIKHLPTSASGLPAGTLWNNGNVINVA